MAPMDSAMAQIQYPQETGSKSFSLSKSDWYKIFKGALIATATALVIYLADSVVPWLQDKPELNAAAVAIIGSLVNALRQYLLNTQRTILQCFLMLAIASPAVAGDGCQGQPNCAAAREVRGSTPRPALVPLQNPGPRPQLYKPGRLRGAAKECRWLKRVLEVPRDLLEVLR